MGNIIFRGAGEKQGRVDVFLDFENAKPKTEEEKLIFDEVEDVLERGPTILDEIAMYTGCQEAIRQAIVDPGPQNEEEAWFQVLPAVEKLKEFYDFSVEIQRIFPRLLSALCQEDPKTSLTEKQALAKQFAYIFDFVLRFDDFKMLNPCLSNDFSYYRRALNRMKNSKHKKTIIIKDEMCSRLSMFLAYPTPMMNALTKSATDFLADQQQQQQQQQQHKLTIPPKNVTTALSLMVLICEEMVTEKKFVSVDTNMFCLRCMVGAIILYDIIHPQGAFCKKSGIPIKACVTALKNYNTNNVYTDGLLNALRFTTTHLHDPETPNDVKKLLE